MKIVKYILFIFLIVLPLQTKAVSCIKNDYIANISTPKEQINIGEEVYITVGGNKFFNATFEAVDDIVSVSENGLVKGLKEGNTKINVSIDFIENGQVVDNCTTSFPISVIYTNLKLKSLNLNEYDLSETFKSDIYHYEITLPYKNDKVTILGEANNEFAKIDGLGEKPLNVGLNEFKIIVSASNSEKITYTLSIFRELPNSDATLKNLIIEGFVLNPTFSPNIYNYTLDVSNIEDVYIKGTPTDKNAKVTGLDRHDLSTGKNIIDIIVTGEDGTESKYQIQINKNKGSSTLKNLEVEGFKFAMDFQSDIYTYNLDVPHDTEKINIIPTTYEEDQVEILSDGYLSYGKNEILIRVTSPDKTTTTYKLIVNRLEKENHNDLILIILFIAFIISIIIVIVLIIILFRVNSKKRLTLKKKKKKKKNRK